MTVQISQVFSWTLVLSYVYSIVYIWIILDLKIDSPMNIMVLHFNMFGMDMEGGILSHGKGGWLSH